MIRIVVDPGHGGSEVVGGSTPFGAQASTGALEKVVALDLALRLRARVPEGLLLTRDDDRNLSLGSRAGLARAAGAAAFLSIHVGGALAGHEAWVHPRASPASRLLAGRVSDALNAAAGEARRPPLEGSLAVLHPDFQAPGAAACLIELGRFGDAASEARLFDPGQRARLADALARALTAGRRGDSFDIWHEVPLVQQLTGMSCWAAAAAMVVGWRDCIDIDAEEVARGAGRWHSYRDGLEPHDVAAFARAWGLEVARPTQLSVPVIRDLLDRCGPIWVGEASPGLHVVVVAGMHGDGSPDGTLVRIADPWPIGRGERYSLSFREFCANLRAAATLAGGRPQLLHARAGSRAGARPDG